MEQPTKQTVLAFATMTLDIFNQVKLMQGENWPVVCLSITTRDESTSTIISIPYFSQDAVLELLQKLSEDAATAARFLPEVPGATNKILN